MLCSYLNKADFPTTPLQDMACVGELNEPARPAAARPVSRDMGGQAAGGSAVRPERRGQDRRKPLDRPP